MDVSLFDFPLPKALIALRPAVPRDSARMLVVSPDGGIQHRLVRDLPEYLRRGDVMVLNNTRVMPSRLHGVRARVGSRAKIEVLLHRRLAPDRFRALVRPARRLVVGDALKFGDLTGTVAARRDGGEAEIVFALAGEALDAAIARLGEMPLPPYIAGRRRADARDTADYQTVFARQAGSAAAPTAGLHFTDELLARLAQKGVARESVTLHVGPGTFLPVTVADSTQHRMHPEQAWLESGAASRINAAHNAGGRRLAIGTTSLRTLESAADAHGRLHAFAGDTDIFITPGYHFRAVDLLLTNFHLPRSTLFMLVCAFMGLEMMKKIYAEAIATGYRFYSYGDACLLLRNP
ncbi:MAG: tRNA preQ1(34) S-adenosylmethionine ribosyltransferase-isomerase QueA [Alphaproteobacteria bacterium]|nr:tRNA preQ1(34) S-adenosylmethionine ribosyltransferase-isomerase QueA [Alphaproteobacteria bacterium]